MCDMTARARGRGGEDGFTLVELVLTVAIVGVIMVGLTGVVIEYLKTTTSTAARYTQSNAVQLVSVYWQRDVASTGLRSNVYNSATHDFALQPSVDYPYTGALIGSGCSIAGTGVVTLAWGQYDSSSSDAPTEYAVTYWVQTTGAGASLRYDLWRTRCSSNGTWTTISSAIVTHNLTAAPTVTCSSSCGSSSVPASIDLTVTSSDPNNNDGTSYQATLTGERRQT